MSISLGPQPIKAKCFLFDRSNKIVGHVFFEENLHFWQTKVEIEVWDQKPNRLQGIHIHDLGDINPNNFYSCTNPCRIPCDSLGGHYDPYQTGLHGDHTDNFDRRHAGDMGNVSIDSRGYGRKVFWDRLIRLRGTFSVLNKAVVLHSGRDDLGRGSDSSSRRTGNSGSRVACGLIFRNR